MKINSLHSLPFVMLLFIVGNAVLSSCRFAPKDEPGDTVAASVFAPIDTSSAAYKAKKRSRVAKDSTGVFIVGNQSNRKQLQLIVYPSHRDTFVYRRSSDMVVYGNADFGHLVRVVLDTTKRGDTIVTQVMEVQSR